MGLQVALKYRPASPARAVHVQFLLLEHVDGDRAVLFAGGQHKQQEEAAMVDADLPDRTLQPLVQLMLAERSNDLRGPVVQPSLNAPIPVLQVATERISPLLRNTMFHVICCWLDPAFAMRSR
jgi:hypothetical protein